MTSASCRPLRGAVGHLDHTSLTLQLHVHRHIDLFVADLHVEAQRRTCVGLEFDVGADFDRYGEREVFSSDDGVGVGQLWLADGLDLLRSQASLNQIGSGCWRRPPERGRRSELQYRWTLPLVPRSERPGERTKGSVHFRLSAFWCSDDDCFCELLTVFTSTFIVCPW